MKQFLIVLVSLVLFSTWSERISIRADQSDKVYVVMSQNAYAYHRTRDCKGLRNARHEITEVSLEKATNEMNRKPCKLCYPAKKQ